MLSAFSRLKDDAQAWLFGATEAVSPSLRPVPPTPPSTAEPRPEPALPSIVTSEKLDLTSLEAKQILKGFFGYNPVAKTNIKHAHSSEKQFEQAKKKFEKGDRSHELAYKFIDYSVWKKSKSTHTHSAKADDAAISAATCIMPQ